MLACCIALFVGPGLALHAQVKPPRSASPRPWDTLHVSVAPADLAAAAGLPATPAPEDLLADVIRVLHHSPLPSHASGPVAAVRDLLLKADANPQATDERPSFPLPLPLAREAWRSMLGARVTSDAALVAAILNDRRAALVYLGLISVDAETREAVDAHPDLLLAIHTRHASPFAAFGGSLRVLEGAVVPPGPESARPAWLSLAGAASLAPETFVPALLARDRGRLAYFYDAVSRLGHARQRWVFGHDPTPEATIQRLAALYEHFRTVSPEWNAEQYPFYRLPLDLLRLLRSVDVDQDGRVRGSASRAFWTRVFGAGDGRVASPATAGDDADADPGWMLARLLDADARQATRRLAQVQFAQWLLQANRATANAGITEAGSRETSPVMDVATAVSACGRMPALLRLLERLDVHAPATLRAMARMAQDVTARAGRPEGEAALVILQTEIAILDAAHASGSLDSDAITQLVVSLSGVRPAANGYGAGLLEWLRTTLVPALATATGHRAGDPPEDVDEIVLRAIAGARRSDSRATSSRVVTWQGERLALDPAGVALGRLRQLHAEQRPASLSALLGGASTSEALRRTASALRDLAYLPHVGDPEGPIRLAPDLPRRHVLLRAGSDRLESAWGLPRELVTPAEGWHVEGAIVGLDVALARLALMRIEADVIPPEPHLDDELRRRFVVHAALGNTREPGDEEARAIAGAWTRGRERVRRLWIGHDDLQPIAEHLGLRERRVEALRWLLTQPAQGSTGNEGATGSVEDRFSAAELVRLGFDSTGSDFAFVTIPGEPCTDAVGACDIQLTDLDVRLTRALVDANLPASLLRWLRRPATQDFVDQVQPAHVDDHVALWTWVRALPTSRIDDYITSLEGRGPLRPAAPIDEKEPRR